MKSTSDPSSGRSLTLRPPKDPSAFPPRDTHLFQPVRGDGGRERRFVVLAAVDLADEELGRSVLAAADALTTGRSGARAEVHVVHAWRFIGETILACPLRGVGPETYRRLMGRVGDERRARLAARTTEGLGREADRLHVAHGDPRTVVPAVARWTGADVIVLGARRSRGLSRRVVEGVADAVAERTACDVVVVRDGRTRHARATGLRPLRLVAQRGLTAGVVGGLR